MECFTGRQDLGAVAVELNDVFNVEVLRLSTIST